MMNKTDRFVQNELALARRENLIYSHENKTVRCSREIKVAVAGYVCGERARSESEGRRAQSRQRHAGAPEALRRERQARARFVAAERLTSGTARSPRSRRKEAAERGA